LKQLVTDDPLRYCVLQVLGEQCLSTTVGAAAKAYLSAHDVQWCDWEDE